MSYGDDDNDDDDDNDYGDDDNIDGDDNDYDGDDIIIIITTIIIAMATRAVSFPHVFLSDKSYYLVRSTGSMMLMANNDKTFPVVYFVHFQDWFTNFGFLHPELFHVLSCRQDLPILFFKNF